MLLIENNQSQNFAPSASLYVEPDRASLLYVEPMDGGERGIRTLDRRLSYTPLAGERLQPLGHLSATYQYIINFINIAIHILKI